LSTTVLNDHYPVITSKTEKHISDSVLQQIHVKLN